MNERNEAGHDAQVLIVGGGPVGLGLAIELGLWGVKVLVLEAHHQPQPIPKGQNLTQRTMEHFQGWGIEEELRRAQPIPAGAKAGGLTAYGTLFGGRHHDWLQRKLVNRFYSAENARLPQYSTEQVLRDKVAQLDSVTFLTGWRVQGVSQTPDRASARAVNEGKQEVRNFSAAFLVGCDGSSSVVREGAGISQTSQDQDRLMALLVFRSPQFDRLLERFSGKSFFNVLHPDFAGYWQFFGRVDTDATFFFHAPVLGDRPQQAGESAAMLHRAAGCEFAVSLSHSRFWDLRFAIADNYRCGRILVAGDAAHSHPPYGGYGINTGFEDARNLGWKLAARLQGWGGAALLDSYHVERHAVFASTATDFIARSIEQDRGFVGTLEGGLAAPALDAALARRAQQAEAEVYAYAPHYCGSPVVLGHSGATISAAGLHQQQAEAGRHLAPALLPCGTRLAARLGRGFSLITCNDALAARFAAAAGNAAVSLAIIKAPRETCGHDHVLVRPDHYVAWADSSPPDTIEPAAILRRACGVTG